MDKAGEQVEAEQHRRQGCRAVTNVVLAMVALGLEDGVVFVGDLPASTPRLSHGDAALDGEGMMGHKAVVRQVVTRWHGPRAWPTNERVRRREDSPTGVDVAVAREDGACRSSKLDQKWRN
jgi:hypothetical protein